VRERKPIVYILQCSWLSQKSERIEEKPVNDRAEKAVYEKIVEEVLILLMGSEEELCIILEKTSEKCLYTLSFTSIRYVLEMRNVYKLWL